MGKTNRPDKLKNLLDAIKKCISTGDYRLTLHALDRQAERKISLPETLHVLETGCEEKAKTSFDESQNTWKYAIKGKTIRGALNVRVIVAFNEDGMLIITVMHIGGL